jgi:hypothetical protein
MAQPNIRPNLWNAVIKHQRKKNYIEEEEGEVEEREFVTLVEKPDEEVAESVVSTAASPLVTAVSPSMTAATPSTIAATAPRPPIPAKRQKRSKSKSRPHKDPFPSLFRTTCDGTIALDETELMLRQSNLDQYLANVHSLPGATQELKQMVVKLRNLNSRLDTEDENVSNLIVSAEETIRNLNATVNRFADVIKIKKKLRKQQNLLEKTLKTAQSALNDIPDLLTSWIVQTITYFTGDDRKVDVYDNIPLHNLPLTLAQWVNATEVAKSPLLHIQQPQMDNSFTPMEIKEEVVEGEGDDDDDFLANELDNATESLISSLMADNDDNDDEEEEEDSGESDHNEGEDDENN